MAQFKVTKRYARVFPRPLVWTGETIIEDEVILDIILRDCYYDGDAGQYIRKFDDFTVGYTVQAV